MIMLKPCLYKEKVSDEDLLKEIETEYFNGAFGMLAGPKKEFAFGLLKDYPLFFVKLIAMYLLGYVAPRIKDGAYNIEEIRIIIPSQRPSLEVKSLLNRFRETQIMDINIEEMLQVIDNDKLRKRINGESVYYRELFLPSNMLSTIYIKDTSKMSDLKTILAHKGYGDREIVCI